jgi:peroxiredoxin
MTAQEHFLQPPRTAVWLLSLFTLAEEAESIQGDLLEEFSLLVSKSGVGSARRWYWRQTMKTVPQLAAVGFRTAPWKTAAAVVGGFLLPKLLVPLVGPAIFAVLVKYQVPEHHFSTYVFFASTGIDIGILLTFLFIGFAVALASEQREMVATITLGLIEALMAVIAFLYNVTTPGHGALLWWSTWVFADCFVIVLAGAIVRTHRLGGRKTMQRKSPTITPKLGFIIVFVWMCIAPALFGQQDVHATLIPAANRKSAPAFQLVTQDGNKTQVSDYRGKVLLLNFWATDCGGCVLEIPSIIELEKAYKDKGFTAVGVSMDISYEDLKDANEAWGRVRPFIAKHGVNYPIAMGDDAISKAYALNAFPATYLIDKSGKIAIAYVGVLINKDNVATNINSLLSER